MSTLEDQELREREEAKRAALEVGADDDDATAHDDLAGGDGGADDDDAGDGGADDDDGTEHAGDHSHADGLYPDTERLMEERGKKLDRLGVYVAKKLVEIFGEEAADELELCELCTWTHTYGWRVPQTPPAAVRDAVKIAIGIGTLNELKPYSGFQTCETCDGQCNVLTGAKAGNELFRQCPSCKGRGYSSTLPDDAARPPAGTPIVATELAGGAPAQVPDFDMFGTPRDHPDYGKLAQHREVPISHWAHNLAQ